MSRLYLDSHNLCTKEVERSSKETNITCSTPPPGVIHEQGRVSSGHTDCPSGASTSCDRQDIQVLPRRTVILKEDDTTTSLAIPTRFVEAHITKENRPRSLRIESLPINNKTYLRFYSKNSILMT